MKLADFPALAKLPKRKRLQLAEELWFSGVDDSLPVSTHHRGVLDERWAAYQKGQAKRLTLSELERWLVELGEQVTASACLQSSAREGNKGNEA